MVRYIFLNIFIFIFFANQSYAFLFKKGKDEDKLRRQEIKKEIKEIKKNPDIYYGEAFAEVKRFRNDLWKATEEARKRARQQLNEYIKIRVDTSLRQVLKIGEKGYKKEIEDIIELYADKVLEEVKYHDYTDYPKRGIVTSIATVGKETYKNTVLKELKNKRGKIITHLRAGLKALDRKLISQAIDNLLLAKKWYEEFFHQVPLNMDLDKDGKIEEIGAVVEVYISSIFKSIEFKQKEEGYTYTLEGNIFKKPIVAVYYIDKKEKIPVSNLLLKIKFVKGEGKISNSKTITDEYGEAEISVEYVKPELPEASIQVEIDLEKYDLAGEIQLPFYRINLKKRKAVAYSVVFSQNGKITHPVSLKDITRAVLSKYGYDIEEIKLETTEVKEYHLDKVIELNADYFLFLLVESYGSSQVGDYELYQAKVGSRIFIYKLPEKRLISSIEGPETTGFGPSFSSASYNGLGKIKKKLLSLMEQEVKKW